jgi:hypothetical protein
MIIQAAALALLFLGNSGATTVPAKTEPGNISNGVQWDRLTPQQIADLRAAAEADRLRQEGATPSERCYNRERKRAGNSPSELELRAIDMKCREVGTGLKVP